MQELVQCHQLEVLDAAGNVRWRIASGDTRDNYLGRRRERYGEDFVPSPSAPSGWAPSLELLSPSSTSPVASLRGDARAGEFLIHHRSGFNQASIYAGEDGTHMRLRQGMDESKALAEMSTRDTGSANMQLESDLATGRYIRMSSGADMTRLTLRHPKAVGAYLRNASVRTPAEDLFSANQISLSCSPEYGAPLIRVIQKDSHIAAVGLPRYPFLVKASSGEDIARIGVRPSGGGHFDVSNADGKVVGTIGAGANGQGYSAVFDANGSATWVSD